MGEKDHPQSGRQHRRYEISEKRKYISREAHVVSMPSAFPSNSCQKNGILSRTSSRSSALLEKVLASFIKMSKLLLGKKVALKGKRPYPRTMDVG
jgi:hypothetical protein